MDQRRDSADVGGVSNTPNMQQPGYSARGLPIGEPCAFCDNEPVGRTEDDDLIYDDCAVPL